MEPAQTKIDEPFGRQPQSVEVRITSRDKIDAQALADRLYKQMRYNFDIIDCHTEGQTIVYNCYSRAVND